MTEPTIEWDRYVVRGRQVRYHQVAIVGNWIARVTEEQDGRFRYSVNRYRGNVDVETLASGDCDTRDEAVGRAEDTIRGAGR